MRGLVRRGIRRHDDTGTATVFVVGLAVILFCLAGLVLDGGLAVNAREQVADDVEQAARAGAERIDVLTLRTTGVVRIDVGAAQLAAEAFLATRGYGAGQVSVAATPATVSVEAHRTVRTALLSIVFVNSFDVSAQATARAAVGITTEVP